MEGNNCNNNILSQTLPGRVSDRAPTGGRGRGALRAAATTRLTGTEHREGRHPCAPAATRTGRLHARCPPFHLECASLPPRPRPARNATKERKQATLFIKMERTESPLQRKGGENYLPTEARTRCREPDLGLGAPAGAGARPGAGAEPRGGSDRRGGRGGGGGAVNQAGKHRHAARPSVPLRLEEERGGLGRKGPREAPSGLSAGRRVQGGGGREDAGQQGEQSLVSTTPAGRLKRLVHRGFPFPPESARGGRACPRTAWAPCPPLCGRPRFPAVPTPGAGLGLPARAVPHGGGGGDLPSRGNAVSV